jgi:hypothetical protein
VARIYTREEADEILRRALVGQASGAADGISHDDLVAAAREVGIPAEALESAASSLGEHRLVTHRVARLRSRKRRAFARHVVIYLIVNFGIFLFDRFDGGGTFFQVPLIIWGVILLVFGVLQLAPNEEALVRRAEKDLEKERRRADKQRRLAARTASGPRGPGAAKEFEAAVEEGVSALLSVAARTIRGLTPEGKRYRAADPAEEDESAPGDQQARDRSRRSRRA